ncbi:MAG: hypothetical protein IBX72_01970 [Nitrospirae bacterium]|jgi:hypothetical protein|nr:hypothetical protein [Nitrospirota bacterium]
MKINERIKHVLKQTKILKWPEHLLATFGSSTVYYYVLTEPVYSEFENRSAETVIREGKITWGQPKILTPSYILKSEGFSEEARKAYKILVRENPDLAGILYPLELQIESEKTNIVSGNWRKTYEWLKQETDSRRNSLTAVIKGVNILWDVSLMKFVLEMTLKSAHLAQLPELKKRGFIYLDKERRPLIVKDSSGIPVTARREIESMFNMVKEGKMGLFELKEELDRWEVFEEYEERFFNLFKGEREKWER